MTYERRGTVYTLGSRESRPYLELYDQPLLARLRSVAFHATACKLPYRWVDKIGELLKVDKDMPLSNHFDCVCFELDHKDNYNIKRL